MISPNTTNDREQPVITSSTRSVVTCIVVCSLPITVVRAVHDP